MQLRLIILGVVAFAFMGLGLVAYHYKVEARDAVVKRDAAIRDRDTAVAVNKHNDEVMAVMAADKAKTDKLAADLAEEIDAANNSTLALAKKLADLRTKDAEVDNFLKLPVPAAVRGMYDDNASGDH